MQDAIRRIASAIRMGRCDPAALTVFIDETSSLPLSNIAQYENAIRRISYDIQPMPRVLPWQRQPDAYRFAVPWFDLFSANGFRRERVLRTVMTEAPSAFLLAVLLRRLNDWIPQVREAAHKAARHAVATSSVDIVVDVAWVLLPARLTWRRTGPEGQAIIDSLPNRPDVAKSICQKILREPAGGASAVLHEASRCASLDEFLPELAASAIQPAVRAAAYRMLLTRRAVWSDGWAWRWTDKSMGERVRERTWVSRELTIETGIVPTLTSALSDPSPAVRRVAGDVLISHQAELGEVALALARQLETDPYPSIAERGRFLLSKGLRG